jgi:hypothetical protein
MTHLPRLLFAVYTLAIFATAIRQAEAQDLFSDPFVSAEALLSQRGVVPSNATLRLRYEASGDAKNASVLVLDVAPDWVHVRRGELQTLHDFRLGRVIDLRGGTFVSTNIMADVAFRVYELQNRAHLVRVLRSAGAKNPSLDDCDAQTELGLSLPSVGDAVPVEAKQSAAVTTLECNGRVVGLFESGTEDPAPTGLWPVLARHMTMHPALRARLAAEGRAPRRVEAFYRVGNERKTPMWRLVSAERIAASYPLASNLTNATAGSINDGVAPGLGRIAVEAVAGRAQGGAPTLASWDALTRRLAAERGPGAAALSVRPALNMFPDMAQACQRGTQLAMCDALRDIGTTAQADGAVRALLDITRAEQRGQTSEATVAMSHARSSPLADHPALGASFALALLSGGDKMRQQAAAAGLPSDVKSLQVRALQAYPYNPGYWTDLGDYFARKYELYIAYLLYDVAFSLPMPDAQRGNKALGGKRDLAARMRADFPAFFLGK